MERVAFMRLNEVKEEETGFHPFWFFFKAADNRKMGSDKFFPLYGNGKNTMRESKIEN